MRRDLITILFTVVLYAMSLSAAAGDVDNGRAQGRYEFKNLKVKSYYVNEQGELARWVDDELVKIDTETGKAWKWVSERSRDKKELKEYWKELEMDTTPMPAGSR